MGENKLVKICCIIGFVLAEVYMVFVVLAPNRPEQSTRMIIPRSMIPQIEGIAPGTPPPPGWMAMRLVVCGIFFGPFGALVGLGVGLLLDGARRTVVNWRSGPRSGSPPPP